MPPSVDVIVRPDVRAEQSTRSALSTAQVQHMLVSRPGWSLEQADTQGAHICKTYRFANYFETMAFVNAVAYIAHREDHHPDLSVHYNRCVVQLNTHDVGGLSATDMSMAQAIDALVG
jgi:4a-hydroxytetrahydrobiopterin dehydratase